MRRTIRLAFFAFTFAAAACGDPYSPSAVRDSDADALDDIDELTDDELDEELDDGEDLEFPDDEVEVEGEVDEDAILEEIFVDDGAVDDELDDEDELVIDEDDGSLGVDVGGPASPTAVKRNLRFLQWNIAGGKENNCKTAGITRAVKRYVRDHDIDFVGLNEVCPSQYNAIKAELRKLWKKKPGVTFSAYVGDGTNRVVGNAIFSRRRLDVISKQKVGHDRFGDRFLLCGRVAARKHLRFCSTHLTPGDATARRQLQLVHDRIEGWWKDRMDTVILTGDLNITPSDQALNKVYSQAANTPNNGGNHGHYRELDDDDPNHCRGYGERSTPGGNGGPCHQGGKIDFILARQNRIVDGDYNADSLNIPGDCTGACSDHRAIVGRAKMRIRIVD